MKRIPFLLLILMLLLVPSMNMMVNAQGSIVIVPPPTKEPDSDRDGLHDSDDKCPKKAGPRTNQGCPEDGSSDNGSDSSPDDPSHDTDGDGVSDPDDNCPTVGGPIWNAGCPTAEPQPDPNDPQPDPNKPQRDPFYPPALPTDGCYVTPNGDYKVNVRHNPGIVAPLLGHLLSAIVYEAKGYMMVGPDTWFVLSQYENSVGTIGYASGSVLVATACPQIVVLPDDGTSGPDFAPATDFRTTGDGQPTLCHLTVGYDSPTWSNDPAVPSYNYAAFYFEVDPNLPLPAGTPIWGVVFVADFISLPDSTHVFVIAPNAAVFEEAMNSGYGGTYNWPTMAGGIQSGDMKLYRLTDDNNLGACGPIEGIDDFTKTPGNDEPGVLEMTCTARPGTTQLDSCSCPGGDEGCITKLAYFCNGYDNAGIEAEDDTVKCQFNGSASLGGDCNNNGIDDLDEFFPPDCIGELTAGDQGETRKEDPDWWETVLDLTCPGDWLMILEIDEDGDEVVTDAQCD